MRRNTVTKFIQDENILEYETGQEDVKFVENSNINLKDCSENNEM